MDNSLNLLSGQTYIVTKSFIDYDNIVHEIGETWTYQGTHFLPYEDGLTLHLLINGQAVVYRLQWREGAQANIIENFKEYVKLY